MGIGLADRILGLDLDTLVTGNLTEVLTKNGVYVGWKLAGTSHPEVYNGSFQMFTAGALRDVWEDFDPDHCRPSWRTPRAGAGPIRPGSA
jgi:hypothetical protein